MAKQNDPADVDDRFIETLLNETYHFDEVTEERRINQLMNAIRSESGESSDQDSESEKVAPVAMPSKTERPLKGLLQNWGALAMAASVLIVCGIALYSSQNSNTAYAAIIRVMEATLPTRQYQVAMVNRWPVIGNQEVTATLYVNDLDQFCLQHPGWLPGGEIWVGGDLDSRWIVPRVGPVVTGNETLIATFLQPQGLGSPMLHMKTLLHRMNQDYDLELLPEETINHPLDANESARCDRIVGVRKISAIEDRYPERIELWANQETGAAQRVRLDWAESDSVAPVQWQIDLVAYPELADDWFEYRGHAANDRTVVPLGSE